MPPFGPPPGGGFGGPRGFGGPPPGFGGFGGPRGFGGPMGHHFRPPGRHITPVGGESLSEAIAGYYSNAKFTFRQSFQRKGIIAGTFLGIRTLTSGSLRNEAFEGKLATYDKQFKENRITELQCKKRKMDAAKKYYRYFLKSGYYDIYDYNAAMEGFASSIGMRYINDVNPSPERGRSR